MAEAALFIGWGAVVRGREAKSLEVFGESTEFFGGLQQDGTIEALDTVLLSPHGGDLYGFFLLRGTAAKLDELERPRTSSPRGIPPPRYLARTHSS